MLIKLKGDYIMMSDEDQLCICGWSGSTQAWYERQWK